MMTEEHAPSHATGGQPATPTPDEHPPKRGKESPPGSRAAKLARLKRDHPRLYAARHVAIAVVEVAVGLLGLKALLTAFLPRIDLSWLPLPDINLPDLDLPPWLDPIGWLLSQIPWPDIDIPGWVTAIVQSGKEWAPIVVPIAIAILVALGEVEKRKRKQREAHSGKTGAGEQPDHGDQPDRDTERPDGSADPHASTPHSDRARHRHHPW